MNIKNVVVLDEAAEDLEAGRNFYDKIEYGIGDYFTDCLVSDVESLRLYAGIHSKHFGFCRMLSKRFPFGIYYEIEANEAIVIAILDMRMNPDTILRTIEERIS